MKLNYNSVIYEKKSIWSKVFYAIVLVVLIVSVTTNVNLLLNSYRLVNYGNTLKGYEKIKDEQGINALTKYNKKFTAWIKVNDVQLSLPVVQAETKEDEDFYMEHDLERYENILGVPYVEHNCNLDTSFNTVIVGHSRFSHTRVGEKLTTTIFGDLINYTVPSNYYNYLINIETLNTKYNYEVMGAFKFSISEEHLDEYSIYNTKDVNSEAAFNKFIDTLNKVSMIDTDVTASYGDRFLTLFTCSEENLDYRVVIVAKLIKQA